MFPTGRYSWNAALICHWNITSPRLYLLRQTGMDQRRTTRVIFIALCLSMASVCLWTQPESQLIALEPAPADQDVVTDSFGTRFRFLEGGRYVQGTSGGERVLEQSFPLSTVGQYYGNAEGPAHVTWITRPFYIAETEVTVDQFRRFVQATGYQTSVERRKTQMVGWDPTPDEKPLYQSYDFFRADKFNWKNPGFSQSGNHPVVGVSHADAKAYCEWASETEGVRYRLPTEAEWEFACRAGTQSWFSFGDKAKGVVHRFGNLAGPELESLRKHSAERQWLLDWQNSPPDGHPFTAPVGSFQANRWGLHDMHGNVWEWCEDLWLDTVYKDFQRPAYNRPTGTAVDPVNSDRPQTATNDFHTIRGGSWYNGDLPCRSSSRTHWDRDDAACYIGIRLVRDAGPNAPTTAKERFKAEQAAIAKIEAAGGTLMSSRGMDIEVVFSGNGFDETALVALELLPGLQRLQIGWSARNGLLSQQGIDSIAKLTRLKSLVFSGSMDPETVDLSPLTRLTNLETLRFPRTGPLDDDDLSSLSRFTSLTEFQCFGIGRELTDRGIATLRGNRALAILHLIEVQATGKFLGELAGCPLQSLRVTPPYNASGSLTDSSAALLARFPTLESLTLDRQTQLTGRTMEVIGGLRDLQQLGLDGCNGFTGADFGVLADLRKLRELNLVGCNAADVAASSIGKLPRIRVVRLRDDSLTDKGVADLSQAFTIEDLILSSPVISDDGLMSLGRINRLKKLTLGSQQVRGTGLGPVCRLPQLGELSLITPSLRDVAFDHLSLAKQIRKIRLAHRGHQPPSALTNQGLAKMTGATWLSELWLPRNDTGMTEQRMLELARSLPKTKIIPYTVEWDSP